MYCFLHTVKLRQSHFLLTVGRQQLYFNPQPLVGQKFPQRIIRIQQYCPISLASYEHRRRKSIMTNCGYMCVNMWTCEHVCEQIWRKSLLKRVNHSFIKSESLPSLFTKRQHSLPLLFTKRVKKSLFVKSDMERITHVALVKRAKRAKEQITHVTLFKRAKS